MTEITVQTLGIWGCFILLCYCSILFRSMALALGHISENLRILNDRLANMNHKLDVIEIKLEKLRS